MLNENKINIKPLAILIAINIIYLFLFIIDSVEGIFALWIVFIFLSLLPFIIRDRRNIIAIIVFLIPFEVSKTFIPFFQVVEAKDGMFNSVFDFARLFMIYSFILWFLSDLKSLVPFVRHKITYVLAIFIGYYLLSSLLISPDVSKGLTETLRYVIYFLFFTMTISFIRKEEDFLLIFKVLILVIFFLAIEGIFEYLFDYYLWYDNGRRASATFLDPNIFARFLVIVLISMIVFKLKNISIFKPQHLDIMILICGITLLLTVSRQGMVLFFLMMLFIAFFVKGRKRVLIISALLVIMAISIPVFIQLMAIRESGLELYDIGQRSGLLLGAVLMFISSPLLGVGAGGFQQTLISSYYDFLPWGIHGDTLSHTYVLTILAEQGLVGFIIFALFLFFVCQQFIMNYRVKDPKLKTYALVIFSAILIIFISSQVEARFFEEPLLWLFLGLLVALGRLNKNRQMNLPEENRE